MIMFPLRWSLSLTALAVSALAAVDVSPHLAARGSVAGSGSPVGNAEAQAGECPAPATAQANSSPEPAPAARASCPADMVEVAGTYCPAPEQICEEYISEKRDRCARFRDKVRCIGKPQPENFCVDRYEYPNEAGGRPIVAVTWDEARDLCTNEGKRLCTANEWTVACEGPEYKPYPYGFARDATVCNFDKPYLMPDNFAYDDPNTRASEIARVSQSEPSGSRQRCVSDYGVYDMTGNVDEWVLNEHGSPQGPEFQSGLKGGWWGPVRNRCRPMTTDHNHWHHGYQIGFRCCKDINAAGTGSPTAVGPAVTEPQSVEAPSPSEAMEPGRS
jgi:sulfatase modifying factor 1